MQQIPGVGAVVSGYMALTGCDPIAGTPVNGLDRAAALAGALGPLFEALSEARACGCFGAGTPVLMADGSYRPIQDIKPGDWVQSANERTGQVEAKQVTATTPPPASQVMALTLTDARSGSKETLTCTPNHPFYVNGKGFVPAGQLGIGSSIVTRAGPSLAVSGVRFQSATAGDTLVYNLTVDGDHTYFVGSVDGGAWVHNTCPKVRAHFNNVVKPAFWKNEAKINPANWGQAELELMRAGKPPTGPDGFSYELHHIVPLDDGEPMLSAT